MALQHYSPEDVTVLLLGIKPIEGFSEGTFIKISKDVPSYTTSRSSDGKIARKYDNDDTYTITLTLMSTSPSNEVLDAWFKADRITRVAKLPIIIKDQLGSTLFTSTTTWIESPADVDFGTTITDRVWTLRSSQAVLINGGNEDATELVEDLANLIIGSLPILEGIL